MFVVLKPVASDTGVAVVGTFSTWDDAARYRDALTDDESVGFILRITPPDPHLLSRD